MDDKKFGVILESVVDSLNAAERFAKNLRFTERLKWEARRPVVRVDDHGTTFDPGWQLLVTTTHEGQQVYSAYAFAPHQVESLPLSWEKNPTECIVRIMHTAKGMEYDLVEHIEGL